jgi:hypothetical protein
VKQIALNHRHLHIALIMSSHITVTDKGIVLKGRSVNFETCEDAGNAFNSEVRCNSSRCSEEREMGGGGLSILICDMQGDGHDNGYTLVIAQHLNKFKRLRKLNLVRCGRRGVVWRHLLCNTCASEKQPSGCPECCCPCRLAQNKHLPDDTRFSE